MEEEILVHPWLIPLCQMSPLGTLVSVLLVAFNGFQVMNILFTDLFRINMLLVEYLIVSALQS